MNKDRNRYEDEVSTIENNENNFLRKFYMYKMHIQAHNLLTVLDISVQEKVKTNLYILKHGP